MASSQYFDFVRNVWKGLSTKDRDRMSELWQGMEQAVAAAYQKFVEARFGTSVKYVFVEGDQRWLPYTFNDSNKVIQAATYTTTQDLSLGVNLTTKHLIKFSWDSAAPIEVSLRGSTPAATRVAEIVDKINAVAGFKIAAGVEGALIKFTSPTAGVNSKIKFFAASDPLGDASEFVLGLGPLDLPFSSPAFPYTFSSPYPRLMSVPAFRNAIRDENVVQTLEEGVDYSISKGIFYFKDVPPENLWAKRSLFDEEWPWNNFGFLMDIYQQNSARYAQIVQGLWFAFWTGPRPENLRKALYLLFDLPVAPYDGVITAVSPTSISVTGRDGVTTSFDVPADLEPIVVLGQSVTLFQPLVSGIDVFDKVNYPGFIKNEIDRVGIQRFLTDSATRGPGPDTDETKALTLLEEYTFLPQISVNAFVKPDLNIANVRLFLDAIKPVIKTYLFQVIIGSFREQIGVGDRIGIAIDMNVTPNVDSNQTTFLPQDVLRDNEDVFLPGTEVDTEGAVFQEGLEVEVRSFGVLIDYFEV